MSEEHIKHILKHAGCTITKGVFDKKNQGTENQAKWYFITLPDINNISPRRHVAISISTPSRIVTNGALPWNYMSYIDRLALAIESGGYDTETAFTK